MEIECPAHAIAIWLEGDNIMVRFPDRQMVSMQSLAQLMVVLKARTPKARLTVGTKAAPVQYDIDKVAEHMKRINGHDNWDDLVKAAGTRQRDNDEAKKKRLLKKDVKDRERKAALALAAELGI